MPGLSGSKSRTKRCLETLNGKNFEKKTMNRINQEILVQIQNFALESIFLVTCIVSESIFEYKTSNILQNQKREKNMFYILYIPYSRVLDLGSDFCRFQQKKKLQRFLWHCNFKTTSRPTKF